MLVARGLARDGQVGSPLVTGGLGRVSLREAIEVLLSAQADGTATTAGTLAVLRLFEALADGVALTDINFTVTRSFAAQADGEAVVSSAFLARVRTALLDAAGVSDAHVQLGRLVTAVSALVGQGAASSVVRAVRVLLADGQGSSDASLDALARERAFLADAVGDATADALLNRLREFVVEAAAGQAQTSVHLERLVNLVGGADATSGAVAAFLAASRAFHIDADGLSDTHADALAVAVALLAEAVGTTDVLVRLGLDLTFIADSDGEAAANIQTLGRLLAPDLHLVAAGDATALLGQLRQLQTVLIHSYVTKGAQVVHDAIPVV